MNPNVLQHQYAISDDKQKEVILSTKGICICTGWYGWDSKNGVCFLCHFDHPLSAFSVKKILEDIKENYPEDHHFKSVLVGGKCWFWSNLTRFVIKKYVREQSCLSIVVKDGPFDNGPCKHRNLVMSPLKGRLKEAQKLTGKSYPKGPCWFFGRMRRVYPN